MSLSAFVAQQMNAQGEKCNFLQLDCFCLSQNDLYGESNLARLKLTNSKFISLYILGLRSKKKVKQLYSMIIKGLDANFHNHWQ